MFVSIAKHVLFIGHDNKAARSGAEVPLRVKTITLSDSSTSDFALQLITLDGQRIAAKNAAEREPKPMEGSSKVATGHQV